MEEIKRKPGRPPRVSIQVVESPIDEIKKLVINMAQQISGLVEREEALQEKVEILEAEIVKLNHMIFGGNVETKKIGQSLSDVYKSFKT